MIDILWLLFIKESKTLKYHNWYGIIKHKLNRLWQEYIHDLKAWPSSCIIISILLNKILAQILIWYPTLNEHETFYFNVINMYGDLEINVFCARQTKCNLARRQWIDVKFDVMGI